MPRSARIVLPGYPHHLTQRGHNRGQIFKREDDFRFYLAILREWKATLGCKIHAFCLMTNHVHLVVDPGERAENLGLLMKNVAGLYAMYVNRVENRTGAVWEGRFKSSPIETDRYLLACCRYVELNPVRALLVSSPELYPWSSYRAKVGLGGPGWLDADPCYLNMGGTRRERERRYREWVAAPVPRGEWDLIRTVIQRGQVCGGGEFRTLVEQCTGQRQVSRRRGRPRICDSLLEK